MTLLDCVNIRAWMGALRSRESGPATPSHDELAIPASGAEEGAVQQVVEATRSPDWRRVRAAAADLLRKYGIDEPPVPVLDMAADSNLTVQFARFPSNRSNVSGYIDTKTSKVIVNVDEAPARQIFTVAHELGHWLLHRQEVEDDRLYRVLMREPLDGPKPVIEREADAFAANLLVPEPLLERYWLRAAVRPSRQSLARLFGVSEDVIRFRLKGLYGK